MELETIKHKVGRPELQDGTQRTRTLQIRLSPTEYHALSLRASITGQCISAWAREQLLTYTFSMAGFLDGEKKT